ncbi:MAG: pyridine nucleotide transhydrogenase [Pseudomonadota bacterium]|uniref:Pyridine nucleotide transhydrogenase n=1 Tax=Marisediminitalea aggregata TaxID=634436 RepID=A0A1M5S1Q3_9ALTE|nr:hypothetical protein [Marisediminitalea aggregata]MAP21792.1 pyridine nucleotide transhydrogenase [Alteromonadaceae bacterium]MCP4234462.1 pyridine nucleotide transhydrogenase [Aestuariibacter sp.]MEC7824575.1 pyridine nucleotide transhydrogenase [Pseudomonadota bacterium]BBO26224.1 hypothetical protein AltI4_06120 [Alteromonas sp. I4]HBY37982.1 pyridine nucleotide transhydrogenase [Alteromonas sp.]|tara:strand:+ start:777 stop:1091 length:315 start_codon:yes stop_codon:yes gene_type:complete
MRKFLVASVLAASAFTAQANAGNDKAFACMDAKTFEINSSCMVDTISNNMHFKAAQQSIVEVANANSAEYAIATMTFDAKKMTIDIVAHRDALLVKNNLAQPNR